MALPIELVRTDPGNEEVRKSVKGPPDLSKCYEKWLTFSRTYPLKNLMSGSQIGWKIMHIVSRFVDGVDCGMNGDWTHLAGLLELHSHDITRIRNFSTVKTGATLEVLSVYTIQEPHAKLSKLLEALWEMERFDIFEAIKEYLEALFNNQSQTSVTNSSEIEMDSGTVLHIVGEEDTENSDLLQAIPTGISLKCETKGLKKKRYTKTILLTFAQDGYDLAMKTAQQIRSLNLGLGIVILDEHRDELEYCGDSLFRWFHEVDYIIPIITDDYLWQISPRKIDEDLDFRSEPICIDAQYARIIYVMMLEEYRRNKCLNVRVRPIESDKLSRKNCSMMNLTPLFSYRRKVNQVNELAKTLASAKARDTNLHKDNYSISR